MRPTWLDPDGSLLGRDSPLPLDRPFSSGQAVDLGVSRRVLSSLVDEGLVRRVVHGVYAAAQAPDDLVARAQALTLVVPPSVVVVDRTAAWLHGVDLLPRTVDSGGPAVQLAQVAAWPTRRKETSGVRRGLLPTDVTVVHGVRVTTALRTALDLGRLLWRFDALAAIDGFLRIGVPHEILVAEIGRFRGYRGVRQLRALAPLGDPRSESPGESGLRLHWIDAGLPRPSLQHGIVGDDGRVIFRLDCAEPVVRFAAEYDGRAFHGPDRAAHDERRRRWITEERGWTIEVFTAEDLYQQGRDPLPRLISGHRRARRSLAAWTGHRTRSA